MQANNKSQIKYLFATNPKLAKEFTDKTLNINKLSEKKKVEKNK